MRTRYVTLSGVGCTSPMATSVPLRITQSKSGSKMRIRAYCSPADMMCLRRSIPIEVVGLHAVGIGAAHLGERPGALGHVQAGGGAGGADGLVDLPECLHGR